MSIQREFENRVKMCCEERVYANAAPSGARRTVSDVFPAVGGSRDAGYGLGEFRIDPDPVAGRFLRQYLFDEAVTLAGSVRQAIEGGDGLRVWRPAGEGCV